MTTGRELQAGRRREQDKEGGVCSSSSQAASIHKAHRTETGGWRSSKLPPPEPCTRVSPHSLFLAPNSQPCWHIPGRHCSLTEDIDKNSIWMLSLISYSTKEPYNTASKSKGFEKRLVSFTTCCVCVFSCSVVSDSATTRTIAHQAPLSMGFPSAEYQSRAM